MTLKPGWLKKQFDQIEQESLWDFCKEVERGVKQRVDAGRLVVERFYVVYYSWLEKEPVAQAVERLLAYVPAKLIKPQVKIED